MSDTNTPGEDSLTDSEPSSSALDADRDTGEYSRRGFMETAGAMGAAGVTAGLAGCTFGSSEGDFVFWTMRGYNDEEQQAITETAEDFADNTDEEVTVDVEVIVWDDVFESWRTSMSGRSTPNVSEMANEHAVDFGYDGAVIPNTEIFNEQDDWYETPEYWGEYDGEVYGYPWFVEVRNFYANMDLVEEAGHDSVPETWEEMITMAMDVEDETDASGFVSAASQSTGTGQVLYGATVQAGGSFFDYEDDQWSVELDSPRSLFSHLWMASFQEEWDIVPGAWSENDASGAENLYSEGGAAFMINGGDPAQNIVQSYEDIADATEVTMIPEGPMETNTAFMGGSCLSAFDSEFTEHDRDDDLAMEFIEYMTEPSTMEGYFPEGTPTLMPVREAQEEIPPFTDNPTDIPDEWIDARVDQAADSARYGITGPERNAPFLGDMEGDFQAYSVAISGILGDNQDPGEAIVNQANDARETITDSDTTDYELEQNDEPPTIDDIPDDLADWVEGNGDTPQIWRP